MLRHVTLMLFSAFPVVGNKSPISSGLSTEIYQEMYHSFYEIMECLLSFGAETFDFQFGKPKLKNEDIHNYNFACCFVWVAHTEGGT